MNPLHPWALLIGTVALALPIAIHLLTKPKPVAIPLSTLQFLQELVEQRRARSRLRDWLVLLLRALAIGLIALAIARPRMASPPVIVASPDAKTARVVIIDQSQSMLAGQGTSQPWQRAQIAALRYLDYANELQAGVVLCGAKARGVFDRLSGNFESLREAVKVAKPLSENANVSDAIAKAGQWLATTAPDAKREVVIVSDFQRSDWGGLSLESLPPETNVLFESVGISQASNLAILSVRVSDRVTQGQSTQIQVEVANYTDVAKQVVCRMVMNNNNGTNGSNGTTGTILSFKGNIGPQQTTVLQQSIAFDTVGWPTGRVQIEDHSDVQPLDDVFPIAFHVQEAPKILLVTRQPALQKASASYFLEQALSVVQEPSVVERVRAESVQDRQWNDASLIVLDHPGQIPRASLEQLAAAVRRGRGLLMTMSELSDGTNHQTLAEILGSAYQPPIEWTNEQRGEVRKGLFVTRVQTRQPPFQVFGDSIYAGLGSVKIGGGLPTRATREGLKPAILSELSDGSAWLTMTDCESGRIAVLNGDLQQSNFAQEGIFVPIMAELSKLLMQGESLLTANCGQTLVRTLPANLTASEPFEVAAVDTQSKGVQEVGRFDFSPTKRSIIWTWAEPPGPGIYQVKQSGNTVLAVATNAPPSEADLDSMDQAAIKNRLEGSKGRIGFRTADQSTEDQQDSWWTWFALACSCSMLAEILILLWFRT
jgi:hypothetical protein